MSEAEIKREESDGDEECELWYDVAKWNKWQVGDWLKGKGYEDDIIAVFKKKNIDGKRLLRLQHHEVVKLCPIEERCKQLWWDIGKLQSQQERLLEEWDHLDVRMMSDLGWRKYSAAPCIAHTIMAPYKNGEMKTDLECIDIGCGYGYYTNLVNELGIGKVYGVDQSTLQQEFFETYTDGLPFSLGNANNLSDLLPNDMIPVNKFDLATAVFLFNYASTEEQIRAIATAIFVVLKDDGGRLIAIIPTFQNENSTFHESSELGFSLTSRKKDGTFVEHDGGDVQVKITDEENNSKCFMMIYWGKNTLQRILLDIGFKHISWHLPAPTAAGIAKFGAKAWENIHDCAWYVLEASRDDTY